MSLSSEAEAFARSNLHTAPRHFDFNFSSQPQTEHCFKLIEAWDIQPGEHVLEIGCGQGDCTAVLASVVGDAGHVTAVDPGSPDYGMATLTQFFILNLKYRYQDRP